jgi:mRNA interferase MazF
MATLIVPPMATFSRGDVVRVPFPYTDVDAKRHRPALVVSSGGVGDRRALLWVVMITSAANRGWPGDVPLVDECRNVGLPVPSIVRTSKIATIEARHAKHLGKLSRALWTDVEAQLRSHLALD